MHIYLLTFSYFLISFLINKCILINKHYWLILLFLYQVLKKGYKCFLIAIIHLEEVCWAFGITSKKKSRKIFIYETLHRYLLESMSGPLVTIIQQTIPGQVITSNIQGNLSYHLVYISGKHNEPLYIKQYFNKTIFNLFLELNQNKFNTVCQQIKNI